MFKKNKPSRLPHPIPSIGCFARPPAVWEQVHWLHCWNNSPRLWSEQNSPHCPAYRGHAGHSCNTQELTQTNSTKTKSPKESQKYMSFQNETYVPAFVFQGWAVKLRKIHADSDLSKKMVSILLAEQNPKKKDERGIHFWKYMYISSLHYAFLSWCFSFSQSGMLVPWRVWQSQNTKGLSSWCRSTSVGRRVAKGFRLGQRSRILWTLASMPSSSTLLRQTRQGPTYPPYKLHIHIIYVYITILLVIRGNLASTALKFQTNVFKSWGF